MNNYNKHSYLFAVTGILLLTTGLSVIGLNIYTLNGDEYNSIAEATTFGLNWNSLPYFALLSGWQRFGTQTLWLRLPAVFSGVVAVACFFALGKILSGAKFGIVVSLLAATSPFLIYQSQQVRFYSFLVLTTILFLMALAWAIKRGSRNLVWIAVAGVLLVLSHFLGSVAVFIFGAAGLTAAMTDRRLRVIIGVVFLTGIAAVFLLPTIPVFTEGLWSIYQTVGNAMNVTAPQVTPISLINLAKIGFAVYVFGLGYHVYPLWLWLSVPFLLLLMSLLVLGAVRFGRIAPRWGLLPIFAAIGLAGVYIVLDSVGGRLAGGVAPRHVAFIWPVVILVLGAGILQLPRSAAGIALVVLVGFNIAALVPRWQQSWSYATLQDYRAAADFATQWLDDDTLLLFDGRSTAPIATYFPDSTNTLNFHSLESVSDLDVDQFERIVFVTNDHQADRRELANDMLAALEAKGFHWQSGRVNYPLFEYSLAYSGNGHPVDEETGQIAQPLSIYGGEFEHLALPVVIELDDNKVEIVGAFSVSSSEMNREQTLPLQVPHSADTLHIVTTVIDNGQLSSDEVVAELILSAETGEKWTIPLRLDIETASWDSICSSESACETIHQWHKKISLVGQAGYEGAYRDFQAGLHATTIAIPTSAPIGQIDFVYSANSGQLFIWVMAFDDR